MRIGFAAALAATLVLASSTMGPTTAEAQSEPQQVETGFKGVIGLGLVGAELGFIIPAVAGLDDAWAFVVFPLLGAGGGATAGYFLLEEPGKVELSVGALAFGMAMIIPSMVITLSATAYDPEDEGIVEQGDEEYSDEFSDDGVEGGVEGDVEESAARRQRRIARAGAGVLRYSEDGLMLGVPGLGLRASYSMQELQRYGGEQRAELHLPLLSGAF